METTQTSIIIGTFAWEVDSRNLKPTLPDPNVKNAQLRLLTPKQFRLLRCLYDAHPRVIQKEQIIDYVWESRPTSTESLPQLINRTRQVIGDDDKKILVNEPGVGYHLNFTLSLGDDLDSTPLQLTESPVVPQSKRSIVWLTILAIASVFTLFNTWGAVEALYYKVTFHQMINSTPYPHIETRDDGKSVVTIDGYRCVYEKEKYFMHCTKSTHFVERN